MTDQTSPQRLAKLSWRERIGYGLGDAGFNFYWAIIGSYLIFFYTDIFGISAAAAATMVTITKIVDAFTDPAMGAIADKTNTRWGKFRPYLLFGTLPMMGAGLLTMTTPDLGEGGKLLWAYATYMILMLTYTVLNMPYNSLSAVLTADAQERNTLNSTRFFFAYFTGIIVGAATPDLAEYFGGGDRYSPIGWQITMSIYAVVASILFVIAFATTKERIAPPADQKSEPLRDLKVLLTCKPWIIIFILAMVIMTTFTLRGSSATYYFKYFVERPDLLGTFVGLQVLGLMIGAMSASTLTRYVEKVRLLMVLMGIVSVLCFIFAFVPKPQALGVVDVNDAERTELAASELLAEEHQAGDTYRWTRYEKVFWIIKDRVELDNTSATLALEGLDNQTISVIKTRGDGSTLDSAAIPQEIIWMFILSILISLALGPKAPITWAMYADVADYNEWKTGRRATGMTFAATTFSQKMGSAAGSALMLSVLAALGYQANQAQSNASLDGIVYMQTLAPGAFAFIAIIALMFYDLTGDKLEAIQKELAAKNPE
ncbi:MFS transporter [Gilvimarinus sp. SDUM040013]|uniref:MFS transporter n=1 Tax=Gilvimarinus gilvus TaxID=3058038 RepID=A0ABU4RV68_9GAMM|nr:MFS transporter [Gilvimarinus sp. SDUM040013]MDO3387049.1 MFS transporter [Gilvimarinus sp. SDUM040013]MDX6848057.1 MFS transporter [Gilvimarinus sp. SDUM040013]